MGVAATLNRLARTTGGTIGRRPSPPTPPGSVAAGAGRVVMARGSARSTVPGLGFGPPLEPFIFDGYAPPWWDRDAAMSLPTISRCRDLICSAVSALPFTFWSVDWSAVPAVERRLPPVSWHTRPDPNRTRQWLLAWTTDDLMFYERAHWEIVTRYAATSGGYPSSFRRIPPGCLELLDSGLVRIDDEWGKRTVRASEIVEFLSPIEGLLSNGYRAISIALQLDSAADRFAAAEIPAGVLEEQDSGGEDLSDDRLAELAEQFAAARSVNAIGATNRHVKYREIPSNADDLQLVESRTYQALELARLGNTPPYLVGAPAGTGMTYQNGQQARQDLIDFGAAPYIGCIEQTLSGPNVTPRGQAVRLDQNAWLRNPFTTPEQGAPSPNDMQIADPAAEPAADSLNTVPV